MEITLTTAPEKSEVTRVLVVIDQPLIGDLIHLTLNHGVYVTRGAKTLAEAMALVSGWNPHLAVVDLDVASDQFMRQVEKPAQATPLPVLALTRHGDLKTRLAAFEQGVDDVLTIPFAPEELVARVVALMRRTYGKAVLLTPVINVGELEIDILAGRVRMASAVLDLTVVEQSLLYLLAANAGHTLTRYDIVDALWGAEDMGAGTDVDRHIRNLRAKLHDDWRKPRFILTQAGRGYRFVAEPDQATMYSADA